MHHDDRPGRNQTTLTSLTYSPIQRSLIPQLFRFLALTVVIWLHHTFAMGTPCPYTPGFRYIHTESGLPITVRYIGPLPPSTENNLASNNSSMHPSSTTTGTTWIGVEWDDPARGKHSGTYKGEEVFRCRVPGAGSFLKWKQPVSGEGVLKEGKEFLSAVWDRYIDSQLPTTNAEAASVVLGSSNGNIKVEMPNIDKVARRLRRGVEDVEGGLDVKEIGLEGQWIRGIDTTGDGPWMSLRGKLSRTYVSSTCGDSVNVCDERGGDDQSVMELGTDVGGPRAPLRGATEPTSPRNQVSRTGIVGDSSSGCTNYPDYAMHISSILGSNIDSCLIRFQSLTVRTVTTTTFRIPP